MEAVLYTDGSSKPNPGPSAIGGILYNMNKQIIDRFNQNIGHGGNNRAEYEAMRTGLQRAKKRGITKITCNTDSNLLINHFYDRANTRITNPELLKKMGEIKELVDDFEYVHIKYIPRELNKQADRLAKLGHVRFSGKGDLDYINHKINQQMKDAIEDTF